MRQIVLDTETTGLEPENGHRIWEIGAIEIIDRQRSGEVFHSYLNPQRAIDEEARAVTGMSDDFLLDKPLFGEVITGFIDFIRDSELIIHNAEFDIGFLNHELSLLEQPLGVMTDYATVLDSLDLARKLHPGMRNSLDALCKRYQVDNSRRTKHGALLDAELLAEVYLYMTGGQTSLSLAIGNPDGAAASSDFSLKEIHTVMVRRALPAELELHRTRLESIREKSGSCLWLDLAAD